MKPSITIYLNKKIKIIVQVEIAIYLINIYAIKFFTLETIESHALIKSIKSTSVKCYVAACKHHTLSIFIPQQDVSVYKFESWLILVVILLQFNQGIYVIMLTFWY